MALSPLFTVLRNQDPGAFFRISRDWRALLRLHFLHAALDSGLLKALDAPRTRDEMVERLEVERGDLLDALLDMGVSLGELARDGAGAAARYRLKGSRARALRKEKNDALAAMVQANVTYYNSVFRHLAGRMRGGPMDEGVAGIGSLVARASRIAEPYMEHLLRKEVSGAGALRLLDVGCAAGHHLRSALETNPETTAVGLEVDAEVVREGVENVERWGLERRLRILQGDIRTPPPELEGRFHRAFLLNVVYYFAPSERAGVLRRIHERLTDDGRLVLVTSCRGHGVDLFSANLNLATSSMEGLTPLPVPHELEEHLREAGFATVERRRLIPNTTYYAFIAAVGRPSGEKPPRG